MEINLKPYFEKYEALVERAEAAFERVKASHGECVNCEENVRIVVLPYSI